MIDPEDKQTMTFEEMEHRAQMAQKKVVATFQTIVLTAFRVLAMKALLFVSLAAGIGFFAWAMVAESPVRLTAACLYIGMVFWPVLFKHKEARDAD